MQKIIIDFGTLDFFGTSIPLRLYGYGLMLVLGFLLALWHGQWRARRAGMDGDALAVCGVLALVGGLVGSRIAYVIQHWRGEFAGSAGGLGAMLNLSAGGLIYYGGVILAIILVLGYLLVRRLPVRRYLDILAICMMIGLAFGRAGCLLNGCCYGARCQADWSLGMRFPMYSAPLLKFDGRDNPFSVGTEMPSPTYSHQLAAGQVWPDNVLISPEGLLVRPRDFTEEQIAVAQASRSLPVKPAQPLGIANALLLAALLTGFYRLRRRDGQVFALMLMLYPVTRFVLESIRDDNAHDILSGVFTHNQYTSAATFLIGAALMLAIRRLPACQPAGQAAGGDRRKESP